MLWLDPNTLVLNRRWSTISHHNPHSGTRNIIDRQEYIGCIDVDSINGAAITLEDIVNLPGPGGKTRLFGGLAIESVFPSWENSASIKTSRKLEWKACVENPKSINATVSSWVQRTRVRFGIHVPLIFSFPSPGGMTTSTWNLELKEIFSGTLEIWGLSMVMYGGFRYSIRNSLQVTWVWVGIIFKR